MREVVVSRLLFFFGAFALALMPSRAGGQTAAEPAATGAPRQEPGAPSAEEVNRPVPQLAAFMKDVEAHQHRAEAVERDYIYHSFVQQDDLDGKGKLKKSESFDSEVFWVNGVRVTRRTATNGKALSPEEMKKENEKIDKRIAEIRAKREKAGAEGKDVNHGEDEISFARMLELGDFTQEHREFVGGRPTIVVDYTGNPSAPTRTPFETAFKDLAGRVWIDEQDKVIQHVQGHFVRDFKLGGGLLASIAKDTTFEGMFVKVNNEAWLPQSFAAHGHARALLFFSFTGREFGHTDDYRKFKATSTISPAFREVDPVMNTPEVTPPPAAAPKF